MAFEIRMPPSKCDPLGTNARLYVPRTRRASVAARPTGEVAWTAFDAIMAILIYDSVHGRRSTHKHVPLFRRSRGFSTSQVTAVQQQKLRRALIKAADPNGHTIRYKDLGDHCFRVGGVNRLQDLGAGPAEIMALGRWSSTVWQMYARRQRHGMRALTKRMFAKTDKVRARPA